MKENINPQSPVQQTSEQLSSQPVQPVENQTETKVPAPKNKLPIILAIIVLFIIFGFGAYYYLGVKKSSSNKACPAIARICKDGSTAIPGPNCALKCSEASTFPTPTAIDETANWKTYEDKENGIYFKYPNDWVTKPYQFEGNKAFHSIIQLDPTDRKDKGPAPSSYAFAYWDNPDSLSLEQFDKKYTGNSGIGPGIYSSKSITKTISGVIAYYQQDAICEPLYCDKYIIPYKTKIFTLTIFYSTNDKTSKRLIFDQILSTFRFAN